MKSALSPNVKSLREHGLLSRCGKRRVKGSLLRRVEERPGRLSPFSGLVIPDSWSSAPRDWGIPASPPVRVVAGVTAGLGGVCALSRVRIWVLGVHVS